MAAVKRVLLIGDDEASRRTLAEWIGGAGEFETIEATPDEPDPLPERSLAAVVDSGRGGNVGAIVGRLRERGFDRPVLLLAADRAGPPASGVEVVRKPVRLGALLTRLRALAEREEIDEVAIGPHRLRPATKTLFDTRTGTGVRLTEREVGILTRLHAAEGRPVPRETLLGDVFGYGAGVDTHTLETHIYRLRRKIERGDEAGRVLVTEAGGYRLAI